jgi:predicted O-methyltransferase YrrM
LTEAQARVLSAAAGEVSPGNAIVEIGSHHGRSTIVLAKSKPTGVSMVAIDPFDDERWGGGPSALPAFNENLRRARVESAVTLIRSRGVDAAADWRGPPIALLYLDGAHDYATVKAELLAWEPWLTPQSTVLLHDAFSSPGVTRALVSTLGRSRSYTYCGRTGSLARFERTTSASRVRKLGGLVKELPYFGRNLAVKVALRTGLSWPLRLLRHDGEDHPF